MTICQASDLNRLLQVYQFWTHRMYPKTQFRDTVEQVEKLCHTKRMAVSGLSIAYDLHSFILVEIGRSKRLARRGSRRETHN